MADDSFKTIKDFGTISEETGGYTKQLKLISIKGRRPVYDIRNYTPNGKPTPKGVTLSREAAGKLAEILLADLQITE